MTIVVWDGKALAADRQCSVGDMNVRVEKIRRLDNGGLLALIGNESLALAMADHLSGNGNWPTAQEGERANVVMVYPSGECVYFDHMRPTPIKLHQSWFAWGVGREFAAGALAMGADAQRAVEIACQLCHWCGMGVQVERVAA